MTSESKPLTFVYTGSTDHGGAAGVLAWSIQSLEQDYSLRVFTLERCKFQQWESIFGTSITEENVSWSSLEADKPLLFSILQKLQFATLNQYVLMRWASAKLPESGVSFSVHNEMAFPSPGIQYIHFPMLMTGRRDLSAKVGQYSSRTKDAFGRFCKRLFKVNNTILSGNLAVCNSLYIEGIYKEYYGTTSLTDVLYPPCIIPDNTRKPHSERDDSIVVIGRAVPHKRFEDAISIQKECRMKGVRLTLHIVSSGGDKDYLAFLKDLTSNHDDIVWHNHVTRIELASLLSTCKYGLHCMHGEHFGMATAEMAGAGCVVFGHDSGGTREILPFDSLRFGSLDDAVNKIVSVHTQSGTGDDLSAKLLEHSKVFSHTEFGIRIRDIVANFNFPA